MLDVVLQARAIEYPSVEAPRLRLRDVFTLPFKYKKFMLCMVFMFVWNFSNTLNAGLWNYHLLNHLGYSYTVINSCSAIYVVVLLLTNRHWEKFLQKHSWIKTFGIACIFMGLPELLHYFFMVIDPVSVNQQGNDRGIQYRTGIYFTEMAQLREIRPVYDAEQDKAGQPLAVELQPIKNFYSAEEYHQKYLEKNPGGYCHIPDRYYHLADRK